jgi:small subunit ribosomal protein MRP21
MSTTSHLRAPNEPMKSPTWASRGTQGSLNSISDLDLRKPNSPSYDLAFGVQKGKEKENEDTVEFASDLVDIDILDFQPNTQPKGDAPVAPRTFLRLVPRTGRTVYVRSNVDVARSFKLLAVQVAQNGLRRDFYQQRFHERPGLKRKRLKSERWQKRFKRGFKATISRVRELTAQGW